MKKILIILVLILLFKISYAENKIYVDVVKNLEVCDLSGAKTLDQINSEFGGNFIDVTAERKLKENQNKEANIKITKKEELIQAKLREQAIAELKKEGKLDANGAIVE